MMKNIQERPHDYTETYVVADDAKHRASAAEENFMIQQ
jgi:hypothetical protein